MAGKKANCSTVKKCARVSPSPGLKCPAVSWPDKYTLGMNINIDIEILLVIILTPFKLDFDISIIFTWPGTSGTAAPTCSPAKFEKTFKGWRNF